jgi:hypothetical protein
MEGIAVFLSFYIILWWWAELLVEWALYLGEIIFIESPTDPKS